MSTNDAYNQRRKKLAKHHVGLTPRQQQILCLRCLGFTDTEIAAALNREVHTIRNHMRIIRSKVVPDELDPDTVTTVAWAWLHACCCLAPGIAMFEECA
jgi:DNA-binding CsgD family transcriptional regulator